MRTLFGLGSLLLASLALLAACGDNLPESTVNEGEGLGAANGTGANGTGANGTGASTSSAGTLSLGASASSGGSDGSPSGGVGSGESCASATQQAELSPVYLVFLLDQSGSMGDGTNGVRAEKWDPVTSALNSFFADPDSAGITASLSLFPLNKNTGTGAANDKFAPDCGGAAYAKPEVPPSPLPDAATFKAAIDKVTPPNEFGTPTFPALVGTIEYAETLIKEDATRKVAIVMVTDGEPHSCTNKDATKTNSIANTAAAAKAVADHLSTYVIGVGKELEALKAIAVAGGTENAFIVDVGAAEQTRKDLLEAINLIRGKSISCELPIPPPPAGKKLDPEKVNVHFTASGQPDVSLPYGTECTGSTAWHYDDPAKPTKVLLCTDTCTAVKADPMAKLAVEFACVNRDVVQ